MHGSFRAYHVGTGTDIQLIVVGPSGRERKLIWKPGAGAIYDFLARELGDHQSGDPDAATT
jgi:hypothetical protein